MPPLAPRTWATSLNLTDGEHERFLSVVKRTGVTPARFVHDLVMGAVEDQLEALSFREGDYL